jgi:hypothetical protein
VGGGWTRLDEVGRSWTTVGVQRLAVAFDGLPFSQQSVNLRNFIAEFHKKSASALNEMEDRKGREVWYNFWDTKLT